MITIERFQFQTGAIKSMLAEMLAISIESFNSKLVRLKAFTVHNNLTHFFEFQFQTGAIKRRRSAYR